ncbi:hypothetical protein R3P38DRAFT_3516144 [Favolaschia claudopus]|uniref:Uncharacterized protein n=1 Tax=Favolaschia claudopus TaxID=2862362 RepID=A0AAW0BSA1_9AGAR
MAGPKKSNSSSGAVLDAIVYLSRSRAFKSDSPKAVLLDANIFFGAYVTETVEDEETGEKREVKTPAGMVACLRFFNDKDIHFDEQQAGLFSIRAQVCQMDDKFTVGESFDSSDYSMVGDIEECIPLHEVIAQTGPAGGFTIRNPNINVNFPARLTICGPATNINKDDGTFEVDASQYTQFSRSQLPFPVSCACPTSPRWPTPAPKPLPYPDKYLQATGWLIGFEEYPVSPSKHKERLLKIRSILEFVVEIRKRRVMPKYSSVPLYCISPAEK